MRPGTFTLQKLIAELTAFWEGEGCLIEQPYDLPVGAGTMHPATFLRVLGPDPWRAPTSSPRGGRPTGGTARTRCGSASTCSSRWS